MKSSCSFRVYMDIENHCRYPSLRLQEWVDGSSTLGVCSVSQGVLAKDTYLLLSSFKVKNISFDSCVY